MAASNPNSGVPDFSSADLQDPTEFKLNSTVRLLWGKIANLYQSGLSVILGADISAPSFTATNQATPPPAGSNILLTRVSGDALYGPKAQRKALVNAAYQGTIIQPAPPSSGGGTTASITCQIAL